MTKLRSYQQDLSQKESPGYVFMMLLLMKEACAMPDKQQMMSVMQEQAGYSSTKASRKFISKSARSL